MSEISVVMPVYNTEKYVSEAIESVLQQSWSDFEFIIIDDGSTDSTLSIIKTFQDERIKLYKHTHDYIGSLNKGLSLATGKYIARMDADDIMNVDRLKIQYTIMEEAPEITVCGSWMLPIIEDRVQSELLMSSAGFIESPLLFLLKNNILFHPTTFIRRSFLMEHSLIYEPYMWAEDYKLWFEIARRKGVFYVESFPLLFYRLSSQQISYQKKAEQAETVWNIKQEIAQELFTCFRIDNPFIYQFYGNLLYLVDNNLFPRDNAARIIYELIQNNH